MEGHSNSPIKKCSLCEIWFLGEWFIVPLFCNCLQWPTMSFLDNIYILILSPHYPYKVKWESYHRMWKSNKRSNLRCQQSTSQYRIASSQNKFLINKIRMNYKNINIGDQLTINVTHDNLRFSLWAFLVKKGIYLKTKASLTLA